MALINLYKVTKTLTDLLTQNITQQIDPSLAGLLNVTAIPPEKVENPQNTLSLHLYHVAEDPYYKNALGPGSDMPNIAKAPMALSLYYILTAHHETNSTFDAETQQKLMGYALKTFHDYPVITDRARINGTFILDPDLRGRDNTLQVILRPVTPEDAITFWSSEETVTARLSAYYEVRVVMLEPEEPKTMPGIVLNLGTFVVQMGTPYLDGSRSLVRFTIPVKNGGSVYEVEASPARVTLDSTAGPPEAHNRLALLGTNLAAGKSRSLFLKNTIWAGLPAPGPVVQTVVDLGLNPNWNVEFHTDRVVIELAPTLTHATPGAATINLSVLPGFYSAFVRVVMEEKVINNELKQIVATSNEVGFAVAPRIAGHAAPDVNGNIQVNLGSEFDPLDTNLADDALQVIVGGEVYSRINTDPPTTAKQFFVTNSPSNLIRIRPHFAVVVTEPQAYPFRLVVNGAESAPFWIELGP
jgi:Pvc16 N-terminal domain